MVGIELEKVDTSGLIEKTISNMTYLKICKQIKELRELKHLTQEELAIKAKISLRSIVSIEKGEKVRDSTIEKVSIALGCTLRKEYFLDNLKEN